MTIPAKPFKQLWTPSWRKLRMLHMHHMPDAHQAYDVFFEKQGFTMVLMYLLESQMEINGYMMGKHCSLTPSTACVNSFHRCGGPPPSMREVWGVRRSRPPALPSIGYRGFAVAPMTLRAPARRVVITSGINGRAMRLLLPPSADGPPPSRREVWGLRAFSKPRIQLRVQGRNPARFKGGYGVPRGFKGEKSKSPPNPLGLRSTSPHSP